VDKRKPTPDEIEIMKQHNLVPERWSVVWSDKYQLEVVSNRSGQRRVLDKEVNNG